MLAEKSFVVAVKTYDSDGHIFLSEFVYSAVVVVVVVVVVGGGGGGGGGVVGDDDDGDCDNIPVNYAF
ncbi:hypothetical protein ACH3XW_26305 [Acanthocheilonema viteae]